MTAGGPAALLRRLFDSRLDRDMRAGAPNPETLPYAPVTPAEAAPPGRQGRAFGGAQEAIDSALALKVLDGWLQNRHQILVPLTVRLGRFAPADLQALVDLVATVLLNASPGVLRPEVARRWFHEHGAGEASLTTLDAALAAPQPLHTVLAAISSRELGPYAYAAAVALADTRTPAGRLLTAYLAARLDLPADAVRAIDRRYRR